MKKQSKTILTIAAVAIGALLIKKRKQAAGVGAALNPYIAISKLQRRGVDFNKRSFDLLSDNEISALNFYAQNIRWIPSKSMRTKYTLPECLFRTLKRTYTKAISGIAPVGAVDDPELADATEYPIYDGWGRVSLIYRDRNDYPAKNNLFAQLDEWIGKIKDSDIAWWATVAYIARGGKFIWSDSSKGGVKNELFATTGSASDERKVRISYLASEAKGGKGIQTLAEEWSADGGDYMETRAGIINALMSVTSTGEAQQIIEQEAQRRIDEQKDIMQKSMYSDVPF
ncbi:MAG: hypothetical protein KBS70_03375 [Bacteroidales bacterium]|nr:hypothetical protein [Candidatus Colicola equi]